MMQVRRVDNSHLYNCTVGLGGYLGDYFSQMSGRVLSMWAYCRDYMFNELCLENNMILIFSTSCHIVKCQILRQSALYF